MPVLGPDLAAGNQAAQCSAHTAKLSGPDLARTDAEYFAGNLEGI
jgi:hypothetical protein